MGQGEMGIYQKLLVVAIGALKSCSSSENDEFVLPPNLRKLIVPVKTNSKHAMPFGAGYTEYQP